MRDDFGRGNMAEQFHVEGQESPKHVGCERKGEALGCVAVLWHVALLFAE
jgi:hypothetical protein